MTEAGALRQEPLAVTAIEWSGLGPKADSPPVWRLRIRLECEVAEVRAAAVLWTGSEGHFTRGWADWPVHSLHVDVLFRPQGRWSNDVIISMLGRRSWVNSYDLKVDPRAHTVVLASVGDVTRTGKPLRLIDWPQLEVGADVFAVVSTDTIRRRGRWRLKSPDVEALGPYAFLATGRFSGVIRSK